MLEQARGLGLTLILVHQTAGQLDSKGVDITDTVDSCTAYKQTFRASDLATMRRIEETSGQAVYHNFAWLQPLSGASEASTDAAVDAAFALKSVMHVTETAGPRMDRNTVIEVSAHPMLSIVRFTHGSGYTQFSAYSTPIVSNFHISEEEYRERSRGGWPVADAQTLEVKSESAAASDTSAKPTWNGADADAANIDSDLRLKRMFGEKGDATSAGV